MKNEYRFSLRIPEKLHSRLLERIKELEDALKMPVSLNSLILSKLTESLEKKGKKR